MNGPDEFKEDLSYETNLDVVGEFQLEKNKRSYTEGVQN